MTRGFPDVPDRTYLVECFGPAGSLEAARQPTDTDQRFLATLAIADDEQLLVLLRASDAAAAARRCVTAGLTVDRVVEATLRPSWRWKGAGPPRHGRATASPR